MKFCLETFTHIDKECKLIKTLSGEGTSSESAPFHFNPFAVRTAKTLWSFDRSECNMFKVKELLTMQE